MAVGDQLSRVTPYVQRLLQDEYVQEQIGQGLTGLRRSASRAKSRNPEEALKDKRLWSQLQDAGTSLTQAFRALNEPAPPTSHRVRRAVLIAAAAGAGAYAWQQRSTDPVG